MKWFSTSGGPFLVANRNDVRVWRGYDPDGKDEHYEVACGVLEYLGLIRIAEADFLVLGDEPHRTGFLRLEGGLALVRWNRADSEDHLLECIGEASNFVSDQDDVLFTVAQPGEIVIFDSALDGSEVPGEGDNTMSLRVGRYAVRTSTIREDGKLRAVLHLFIPSTDVGDTPPLNAPVKL